MKAEVAWRSGDSFDGLSPSQMQEALDQTFSPDRRAAMIAIAPRDKYDRPVILYRKISLEKLKQLITTGRQTFKDYYEDFEAELSNQHYMLFRNVVRGWWEDVFEYNNYSIYPSETRRPTHTDYSYDDIEDDLVLMLTDLFPEDDHEVVESLASHPTYKDVIDFFTTHVTPIALKHLHSGGLKQVFSPYLSASVGGVISFLKEGKFVYLEMVLSADSIIPQPDGALPEKEVLIGKSINLDQITRVYADNDAIIADILKNSGSVIGKFWQEHPDITSITSVIEEWRVTPTEEYLPA